MSPESSTDSYPAFAHIGWKENPGKNLNQTFRLLLRQTSSVVLYSRHFINCYGYLAPESDEIDNASEMCSKSNAESYSAFALNELRENVGKNLIQLTCPNQNLNLGPLVARSDMLTVIPHRWTRNFLQSSFSTLPNRQSVELLMANLNNITTFGAQRSVKCTKIDLNPTNDINMAHL
ncbi:hypothetical protein ANN_15891 [Periplaneta americana]|uniref:Uncharacterized protein n=1 Tax=Periplaneta americana TaxID=6978 RepID=A0ABQ8SIQ6_PERAM|nr:hypothetical protein ANN_15891 [Periplaneta americana]